MSTGSGGSPRRALSQPGAPGGAVAPAVGVDGELHLRCPRRGDAVVVTAARPEGLGELPAGRSPDDGRFPGLILDRRRALEVRPGLGRVAGCQLAARRRGERLRDVRVLIAESLLEAGERGGKERPRLGAAAELGQRPGHRRDRAERHGMRLAQRLRPHLERLPVTGERLGEVALGLGDCAQAAQRESDVRVGRPVCLDTTTRTKCGPSGSGSETTVETSRFYYPPCWDAGRFPRSCFAAIDEWVSPICFGNAY